MSNKYDELLKVWGRELMRSRGFSVDDDKQVSVAFKSEWTGGCETCSWEEKYVIVRYGSASVKYDIYSLESLLKEVLAFGVEHSDSE